MRYCLLILAAGLTIGASAPDRDAMRMARAGAELEGRTAGPPKTCIGSREAYAVESLGDSTLLFRVNRGLVYVNDARGRCPGIGEDNALVTRSFTGNLCRGDRATATDRLRQSPAGTCILGDFVPYRKN